MSPAGSLAVLISALGLLPSPAAAQRASENAVTSAQDAFGTSVGDESIGLYTSRDARGFSPQDAGNMRIEGLYFDQQGIFGFTSQLTRSTTIRVGLSAQSYPFPAPTGIADVHLRLPGDRTIVSTNAYYGPYDSSYGGQVELQTPLPGGTSGIVVNVSGGTQEVDYHSAYRFVELSGLFRWTPSDAAEIIAFAQRSEGGDSEAPPLVFSGGAFLPPKINRYTYFGPDFDQRRGRTHTNFGVITRSQPFGNWRLQSGVFRSYTRPKSNHSFIFLNTQPDGLANLYVKNSPPPQQTSYSGEVRASGVFAEGDRRHIVHIAARGRLVDRSFGGDDTVFMGVVPIGVMLPLAEPAFNLRPQSQDAVKHGTLGTSYVAQWQGVGEISLGVQKSFYRRSVQQPGLPAAVSSRTPWLYNGTVAITATDDLTLYGGYTRGLEESGIAPENAANPGEALPASITAQVDAGLRYRVTPRLTLVAGVFEVSKPYFDRDAANIFTRVGSLTHRGVEVSFSGELAEGLKIVSGAVLLKARVSGTTVDQGLIGAVPLGRLPVLIKLNADYGPAAWRGFSLNAQVKYEDSQYGNRLNSFRIPSDTVLDVGARYSFRISDVNASLRFTVSNLTNSYVWQVNALSGHFSPSPGRRYTVRFAADY